MRSCCSVDETASVNSSVSNRRPGSSGCIVRNRTLSSATGLMWFQGVDEMSATLGSDLSLPDSVAKIAAEPPGDRGNRNHDISRSYFEIGRKLRQELGHDNADWATTAAWASGAVGVIIRHEETRTSSI